MSQNIPVLVLDDEPAARRRVRSLLKRGRFFDVLSRTKAHLRASGLRWAKSQATGRN